MNVKMSKKTKINIASAVTAAVGIPTAIAGSAAIAQTAATVSAVNTAGTVLGAAAASLAAPVAGTAAINGAGQLVGASVVLHSSGAPILSGATGYIGGSMNLLSKVGLATRLGSAGFGALGGRGLGTLLSSMGLISAPAWAVPAACIGSALTIGSTGVLIYQNRTEIAGAARSAASWLKRLFTRSDDNGPEFVS